MISRRNIIKLGFAAILLLPFVSMAELYARPTSIDLGDGWTLSCVKTISSHGVDALYILVRGGVYHKVTSKEMMVLALEAGGIMVTNREIDRISDNAFIKATRL